MGTRNADPWTGGKSTAIFKREFNDDIPTERTGPDVWLHVNEQESSQ